MFVYFIVIGLYGTACNVNTNCQLGFYLFTFIITGLYGTERKVNSDCQLGFICLLLSLQVYMARHVR